MISTAHMDLMAHTGLMESMEAINILKTSRENIVEREDRTVKVEGGKATFS